MFSVVMPVWVRDEETLQLTKNAINSINEADKDVELIIVDNNSEIGGGWLRSISDVYVKEKINLGYPKAVNHGIRLSSQEILCISNNDIKVSKNIFDVTREEFESKNIGSLHYRMVGYNEQTDFGDNIWETGKERWCSSSFFSVRKNLMIEYDEEYGLGGYDDYDFWYRFRNKGHKTAYTNMAYYQHKDSHTQNLLDQVKRSESDKQNRELFKKKFGEYPDVQFYKDYPQQCRIPWKPFP